MQECVRCSLVFIMLFYYIRDLIKNLQEFKCMKEEDIRFESNMWVFANDMVVKLFWHLTV